MYYFLTFAIEIRIAKWESARLVIEWSLVQVQILISNMGIAQLVSVPHLG